MRPKHLAFVALLVALLLLGTDSFFTVTEGRQALITQFGKPMGEPFKEAGLYFKLPFIQEVHYFEERILKWDGKPNQIPTRDKKYIYVDTTARWRITKPLLFLKTVSNLDGAASRLDDIIDSVVRDLVSSHLLVELVRSSDWKPISLDELGEEEAASGLVSSSMGDDDGSNINQPVKIGRQQITRDMLAAAQKLTPQYGIEVIDVQVKRINYVESVQKRVYERMISERKRIASQYRSEGEGEKQRILGKMQRELARIRSEAYKKSQEIRGQADAKATQIYGQAYGQDPEFYSLFKTLETYGNAGQHVDMILSTDGDYYQYLKSPQGLGRGR